MTIGVEDTEFKQREAKRQRRLTEERRRREKTMREAAADSSVNFSDSGDQDEEVQKMSNSSDDAEELPISQYHLRTVQSATATQSSAPPAATPMKRRLVDDPLFVASLDRTNTTPRQAMHIVAPALKAAGVDLDTVSLSTTTIYRARKTA